MSDNADELFTGERFVPGIEDKKLEIEHFQRYQSIRELVRGKIVLDAACGEGYGSNILAITAKSVTGVDIDNGAVKRASEKYKNQTNLRYLENSVADLKDIEDHSIEVVVSFETIEHVPEAVQLEFREEISRVLTKDGLLIMSTPNKEIYSDLYNYQNEFHIKEFYKQEFIDFLKNKFEKVQLYNQYFEVTSVIDSNIEQENEVQYYKNRKQYIHEGKYFIGIASNVELPKGTISSVFMNANKEYEESIHRIIELQNDVEERNQHMKELDEQSKIKGKYIIELQDEVEKRGNHILKLDSYIAELQGEVEKRGNHNLKIEAAYIPDFQGDEVEKRNQIVKLEAHIIDLQDEIEKRENDTVKLEAQIAELQDEVEKRGNHILKLDTHIEELGQRVKVLDQVNEEYEHEKTTMSWKISRSIQITGDFILPPTSNRRFLARVVFNLIKNPKTAIKMLSIKRIKNYFKFIKKEGMEGVSRRYKEALELEKKYVNLDGNVKINALEIKTKETIQEYEKLEFRQYALPEVSIVIPVYNQFEYTYNCLKSIKDNSGDVTYEIIIANDCSTDLTTQMEEVISGICVITNEQNLRFLKNCNNAAKEAKGKYILFLNNDTQVQENWLQPLIDLMERDIKIGLTGSKLVYADGTLQEAGGIFWKDASAWNYGNRCNPEDPEYNYVKEVDYISGASIMVRSDLWKEIGGFDETFAPAYYEDSDLAFEVRKRNYKVVYQPLSVVVHFEGVSNGTDITSGQKAYQVDNKQKFYDKWKEVLEKENFENGQDVFLAKDRSRNKKRILIVDHYVPHYDKDAGGKCTFMYTNLFAKKGFQVTFIGDNYFKHEPYTTELNQAGVEVLYGNYYYKNWKSWLRENGHYFDYVYLNRPHIAPKYIDLMRKYSNAKIIYFGHDLHYLREYRQYQMEHDSELLRSSESWKKIEFELFHKADVIHVVGSYEQQVLAEEFKNKPVRNIPLYIYEELLADINKNFQERNDIIFVGGFGHPPNIDAVLWFGKQIFPKILEKYPDMKWYVVGSKVPKEVQELASEHIIIKGFVPDYELHQMYRQCRLAVVPLRVGAGVKGKVVESAYYQIPLVTTTIGAEGISTEEDAFLVEDDADKMAELINNLYEDYDRLQKTSDNGKAFISKYFMLSEAERIIDMDF